ncbi:hypothetical protein [Terriglobus aquaticus]|uniref:Uncharacterized protein n=1 Tax=Terriglobus aquaticus TaxID=940139 RepID=A0ABW9KQJ0_9BACT|nr:hypothetical protein [Terriglobus aquaticus]
MKTSVPVASAGMEAAAARETRAQEKARRAFMLYPALFSAALGCGTVALTWWCVHDAVAHPHQQISPAALLVGLVYLFIPVGAIRLLCFGGMLLSPRRREAAGGLLPGASGRSAGHDSAETPPVTVCRRIGVLVLAEAATLLAVWTWCIVRLLHAA